MLISLPRFATVLLLGLLAAAPGRAAPGAELWERWATHDPGSTESLDHGEWTALLQAYLKPGADGIYRFAYGAVSDSDRQRLNGYVARLAATPVSGLSRPEQGAYWINLYNALTVQVILDHFPVDSIRDIDISPGLFADGPWGRKLVTVEGEEVSLDDIEHRILRPIWQDPRIHYAVNCASVGCPNLQPEAFTAANAEALMEAGARAFINHPRGARFDDGRLVVSSIYEWFQNDFGGNDAGVIAHLKRYADAELKAALGAVSRIADDQYDWSLNDAGG